MDKGSSVWTIVRNPKGSRFPYSVKARIGRITSTLSQHRTKRGANKVISDENKRRKRLDKFLRSKKFSAIFKTK